MHKKYPVILIIISVMFIYGCTSGEKKNGNPTRLLVGSIKPRGVKKETSINVEKKLVLSLEKYKGKDCRCILYHRNRDVKLSINRHLNGSISKQGTTILLVVNVVDGEKGRVLFSKTSITDDKNLDETIDSLALKISKSPRVW
ncbi:hypothetical protein ACFL20_10100 [Spirochaetota bacterium]